ncbi:MAG: ABC transporter permease [Bacteroidota bacterium]|nr:MAG: ABC transporter permease [Bacteroidota bacterium]
MNIIVPQIGWKNVWRNQTRSLVVIVAVMLGIFGGTMATGIMQGWIAQRIHDVIHLETSHVQIHHPEFQFNEEIMLKINNYPLVASLLDTMPQVEGWSPRVKIFVMAQSNWAATGFMLKGITPSQEKKVSEIDEKMVEGSFLEDEYKIPSIVLGSKTAQNLKLLNYQATAEKMLALDSLEIPKEVTSKIKALNTKRYRNEYDFRLELQRMLSKKDFEAYGNILVDHFSFYRMGVNIVLTMQTLDGEMITPVFKVRGIYKTSNSNFDGTNAFVDREQLSALLQVDANHVNEIAIIASNAESGIEVSEKLESYQTSNQVMSWKTISPEIAMYTEFANLIGYIYVLIILLALAFGIINTMLMSVLERVKELGMLMAIGMNKKRVFYMIMFESVFLTLTGALAGLVFSGTILHITSKTGISFGMWAEGFEAIGFSAVVYPIMTATNYLIILILVVFTGIISSVWPARKALKLNPSEALRTE